ncbi:MAG: DinB family protein, partial [Vicinamibacterales bacterium]
AAGSTSLRAPQRALEGRGFQVRSQLPPDVQKVLDQIADAGRVADALVANMSDEQFQWQPDAGRSWSVGQCLEHLATINALYGGAIRRAVDEARRREWSREGPLAPGPFGRCFITSQEPPVKRRLRAPGSVRPGSALSREEILRRYRESHDQLRQLAADAAGIDANRATFPNPLLEFLRVKVATGLYVLPAHERRHLWQAQRVTERAEFPKNPGTRNPGAPSATAGLC